MLLKLAKKERKYITYSLTLINFNLIKLTYAIFYLKLILQLKNFALKTINLYSTLQR